MINSIKDSIVNMDYDWKKPQTYLAFVPVVSLIVEIVQFDKILPLPDSKLKENQLLPDSKNINLANEANLKFAKICKWHLRGNIVQVGLLFVIAKVTAIALPFLFIAGIHLGYTLYHALRNKVTVIELNDKGTMKSIKTHAAANIF